MSLFFLREKKSNQKKNDPWRIVILTDLIYFTKLFVCGQTIYTNRELRIHTHHLTAKSDAFFFCEFFSLSKEKKRKSSRKTKYKIII